MVVSQFTLFATFKMLDSRCRAHPGTGHCDNTAVSLGEASTVRGRPVRTPVEPADGHGMSGVGVGLCGSNDRCIGPPDPRSVRGARQRTGAGDWLFAMNGARQEAFWQVDFKMFSGSIQSSSAKHMVWDLWFVGRGSMIQTVESLPNLCPHAATRMLIVVFMFHRGCFIDKELKNGEDNFLFHPAEVPTW